MVLFGAKVSGVEFSAQPIIPFGRLTLKTLIFFINPIQDCGADLRPLPGDAQRNQGQR